MTSSDEAPQGKSPRDAAPTTTRPPAGVGVWALGLVVLGLLVGLAWLLLVRREPLGEVSEWFMRVRSHPWPPERLLGPVAVIAAFGGMAAYMAYLARRHGGGRWGKWCRAGFVAALVLGAFLLQVAIVAMPDAGVPMLVAATYSEVSTEYFAAAWQVRDPGSYLRAYHEHMVGAQYHVGTHPPGAVLLYYALIRAYWLVPGLAEGFGRLLETGLGAEPEAIARWSRVPGTEPFPEGAVGPAAFCSLVVTFLGAVSLAPIYWLAMVLGSHHGRAIAGTALFATVPSLLLFVPALDHVLLLFAATVLALLVAGWRRGKLWLSAIAGLVWGVGCFVSFGLLALGPVVVLFLGLAVWGGRAGGPFGRLRAGSCPTKGRQVAARTRLLQDMRTESAGAGLRRAAVHLGLVCAGVVVVGLVVWLGLGVRLPEVWAQGMAAHREVTAGRTYSTWVWMNLLELALFLGLPTTAALVATAYWALRRRGQGDGQITLTYLALAALATILLLDVSGRLRGEVGRIWLFLMPPLVLLAAGRMWQRRHGAALWGIVLGGQVVQVLMMALTMTPIVRPW
ncbi:MAG: hypothetical protein ACE5R4_16835 [Armatimonadota bacterium]